MKKINANINPNEIVISATLYRALFLLREFYKRPMNLQEIREVFSTDKVIGTKFSDDTIRMTVMTLKAVGCEFERPSVKNDYRYKLKKSPFIYKLTDEDIEFLSVLREQMAQYITWENLLKLNALYEKLFNYMCNTKNADKILTNNIFENVNLEILNQLTELCNKNMYISILYSSQGILKNIDVLPRFMKYENGYVYLWAYNDTHQAYSFLRADRIKRINKTLPEKPLPWLQTSNLILKINKNIYQFISTKYPIKIMEESEQYLKIEIEYLSEFRAIQNILEWMPDCEVLFPTDMREKVREKLKTMKELYKE